MSSAEAPAALAGLTVLDLTSEWGAYATKLLADMGADVIKIEPPGGDPARAVGPFAHDVVDPERSLRFWHFNTSKRSVVLDLADEAGRAALRALAARADLVIEDRAPGELDALGLGYDALARVNPALVVTSVTPFGQSGPYAGYRASDLTVLAMGGLLDITGDPDRPPVRPFGGQAYQVASLYAAFASLAALRHARATGEGQHVDVSAQACIATCSRLTGNYIANGVIPHRQGPRDFFVYPADVFPCRDGDVLLITPTQDQWLRLVAWIASEGMAVDIADERFEAPLYRRDHHRELLEPISRWTRTHTTDEIFRAGQERRLPFGSVATIDQVVANPHLAARGFFVPITHPALGETFAYPGPPYLCSRTPWRALRAPALGEHTHAALATAAAPPPVRAAPARAAATGTQPRRPLDGVRVTDFTWVWAGPFASRLLADFGAEVIRVERPDARAQALARAHAFGRAGIAPGANALHRNKRSLTVDWKEPRGMAAVRDLIARSDVVIENFSAGTMDRVGLGYERLRKLRPDIILVSLSGFGHTGPWSRFVSYGPTLQALAGLIDLTGYPDRPGVGVGEAYPDVHGGLNGALAALMALAHRDRTGEGQFIDVAQLQTTAAVVGGALLEYAVNGRVRTREGNERHDPLAAPHGVYPCRGDDRWCAIAVTSEDEWLAFRRALGEPAWAREPAFATMAKRFAHRDALDTHVAAWTCERAPHAVMDALQAAGVPAGAVQDTRDLVDRDPQLAHRGFWSHPLPGADRGAPPRFEGIPATLSRTPGRIERAAPMPGDDNQYVLGTVLGRTLEPIAEYVADGVVS
ncbi:MAG: CoA transferase [Dehalococcoidia bacterium]